MWPAALSLTHVAFGCLGAAQCGILVFFFLQVNAMIGRCFVSVSICFKECAGGTAMSKVVVFALAILEAGGTYVPCDERLPWPRVSYMLTMSSAKLLIAGGEVEVWQRCFKTYYLNLNEHESS